MYGGYRFRVDYAGFGNPHKAVGQPFFKLVKLEIGIIHSVGGMRGGLASVGFKKEDRAYLNKMELIAELELHFTRIERRNERFDTRHVGGHIAATDDYFLVALRVDLYANLKTHKSITPFAYALYSLLRILSKV
jgi:hypothetical protein